MQVRDLPKQLQPTIAQYQQLVILEKDDAVRGFDREIRFAAIMTNKTYQEAEEDLEMNTIIEINRRWKFPDMATATPRLPKRVWIKGRLFSITPDFTKLLAGEFTAFEHMTRTPENAVRDLHLVLALLTREYRIPYLQKGKQKETPEAYLARAEFLQDNAPAWIGCMVSAFFLQVWKQLSDRTRSSQAGTPATNNQP
jgi:hypothetical protein